MGIGFGGYGDTGTQVCMGVLHVSSPLQGASPGGVFRIQQFVLGGDITTCVGRGWARDALCVYVKIFDWANALHH